MWRYFLLILAVLTGSTAVIVIKQSQVPAILLASYRLLFAAIILTPLFIITLRKYPKSRYRDLLRGSLVGAVFLALHFIFWSYGARMTNAANGTLIVNLVPVAMPFMLWIGAREMISRREVIGSILSLAGMIVLTMGQLHVDGSTLAGDIVCFIGMLLVTVYLIAAKRARAGGLPIWLYIVPLYWMAGVICFAIAVCTPGYSRPLFAFGWREYGLLLYLAAVPTVIGHTMMNYAMQTLRGQVVSVFNLGQFMFAGVFAYFMYDEVPRVQFYIASALVVAGGVIVVMKSKPAVQRMQKEAALIED